MSNLGGRGKSPPPPTFHSNGLIMKLALLIVVLSTSVYLLVTSLAKLRRFEARFPMLHLHITYTIALTFYALLQQHICEFGITYFSSRAKGT